MKGKTPGSSQEKMREMRKEKLRLERLKKNMDEKKRLKEEAEAAKQRRFDERSDGGSSPTLSIGSLMSTGSKKSVKHMKCGRCGQMGHTKSNKRCPARPLSEWEEKDASYELPTVE